MRPRRPGSAPSIVISFNSGSSIYRANVKNVILKARTLAIFNLIDNSASSLAALHFFVISFFVVLGGTKMRALMRTAVQYDCLREKSACFEKIKPFKRHRHRAYRSSARIMQLVKYFLLQTDFKAYLNVYCSGSRIALLIYACLIIVIIGYFAVVI